jgi:exonuclease III
LRTIFDKFINIKQINFIEQWANFLDKNNIKISNNFLCDLIKTYARKGTVEERNRWEAFQKKFSIPIYSITNTSKQMCTITTRLGQVGTSRKSFPSSIVVWNGNGIRARWCAPHNELKSIVHATNPDLLCFLEAKTDAEKLLTLQGFEDWVNEKGFTQIFCYWSNREDKVARGCEGILIFSKLQCRVTYGMGNPEFDKQARVATVELPGVILVISYNPQGGFSEESLGFRERWEKAFTAFLHRINIRGEREKKGIIWAGDFNVNPYPDDWSERAFDPIRKKILPGTLPAGCREQDQESYRRMVEKVNGVNVGEIFCEGHPKRTCFQNEYSLHKNFGQRIDHVVAQAKLIKGGPGSHHEF